MKNKANKTAFQMTSSQDILAIFENFFKKNEKNKNKVLIQNVKQELAQHFFNAHSSDSSIFKNVLIQII
jgi:hypothetical protein